MNVMRCTMIYLRNNPSVFFYEAGNSPVSGAQMQALAALRTPGTSTAAAATVIATWRTPAARRPPTASAP